MDTQNKTDVIVVGGGPAGIAAAVTAARAGAKVVLIERGKFSGSKNVFGGAVYASATREIFPDFEQNAPLERKIVSHKFAILGETDATVIDYINRCTDAKMHGCADYLSKEGRQVKSYSVLRGKFDRWMADEAKKEGVVIVEETVVKELLLSGSQIIGVKTELEDYHADVVILADGVNSLLAKQIGLRGEIDKEDVALSVKEVIKINKDKLNERFHLNPDEGCVYQFFGGPMLGMTGMGFLYVNKNSVSIGLGVVLDELVKRQIKPYDMLEELKSHPAVAPLIKDGELLEYCAHLIPEGGYKKMPKLYGNGVLVAGDAGMLVNNVHWEGTNLAMISGKIAGETAVMALGKKDFSAKTLSRYQNELNKSFVMKDLYAYRNVMGVLHKRGGSLLGYYPRKINEFFRMFTAADGVPKRNAYRKFIKHFFTGRNVTELFKDGWYMLKLIRDVLK